MKTKPAAKPLRSLSHRELAAVQGGGGEHILLVVAEHQVDSPRDPSTGLPTGKRMH
jgi:hypothetical protein